MSSCTGLSESRSATKVFSCSAVNGSRRMGTSRGSCASIAGVDRSMLATYRMGSLGSRARSVCMKLDASQPAHFRIGDDEVDLVYRKRQLGGSKTVIGVKDGVVLLPQCLDNEVDDLGVLVSDEDALATHEVVGGGGTHCRTLNPGDIRDWQAAKGPDLNIPSLWCGRGGGGSAYHHYCAPGRLPM